MTSVKAGERGELWSRSSDLLTLAYEREKGLNEVYNTGATSLHLLWRLMGSRIERMP